MDLSSTYSHVDILNRITCLIETPNGKGTAVLVNLNENNRLLLLTAKHCLLGHSLKEEISINEITLTVPGKDQQIALGKSDELLLPANEDIDAVAILLAEDRKLMVPEIQLLNRKFTNKECFFRGFPKAYRAKKGITIRPAKYVDHNVVTTHTSLSTIDSDPLFNVKGFSGSGVFCEMDNSLYLIGIIYKFEEVFQRFLISDLSFLKDFQNTVGSQSIQFSSLPSNKSVQNDIKSLSEKTNHVLSSIKSTLNDGFCVEREKVKNKFNKKFKQNELIIFEGIAGSGKSAFAKNIITELAESFNYKPLAFKAEFFAKSSLEQSFSDLENSIENILEEIGKRQKTLILIDSLEKLLEVNTYEALIHFLEFCRRKQGVKVIITCRSYAYQQLIFDLHQHLPKYDFLEIPVFSDEELKLVSSSFPQLKSLLKNKSFKKILRRPFYLNLILLHIEKFKQESMVTEKEVRQLIWNKVVTKNDKSRSELLEQIALKRALSMNLYVMLDNANRKLLTELRNDEIIQFESDLEEACSPSHDIYEDIALIRFIERTFQNTDEIPDFFESLDGKQPAIRRAFRLWLNEQLEVDSESLSILLEEVFVSPDIEKFWKDEVIISILKSTYCEKFFEKYWDLLSKGDFDLFLQCIDLLRTTCQYPDEETSKRINKFSGEEVSQNMFLKPTGSGWKVIINSIHSNLDRLYNHRRLILQLIFDWSKKLSPEKDLPDESKAVGKILLCYLKKIESDPDFQFKTDEKEVKRFLQILFQLASIFKEEIKDLIITANSYELDGSNNFQLRDIYRKVIELTLSGIYSREVCRVLPGLVSSIALSNWIEDNSDNENFYSSFDMESDFGLKSSTQHNYFPASIYKTPIRFLLYSNPSKALFLITTIINHATKNYSESERGQKSGILDITLKLNNDTEIPKKGNNVIWGMYRGYIEAVPDLLKSVLMSLEQWLLTLCKFDEERFDSLIKESYNYLYKNSKSVATTAVLNSVALAYPEKIGESALPIIKVKEFYEWDRRRYIGDKTPLAPVDHNIPFAQKENAKFNQLPHRKLHLENLVTSLQVKGYWDEVNSIIDDMLAEADPNDTTWRHVLNRIDFRNYQVDDTINLPDENKVALTPKIDEGIQKKINEENKDLKKANNALSITHWARNIFEGEDNKSTYKDWKSKFASLSDLEETFWGFKDPTYLAATGIKYFSNDITKQELEWSIKIILGILADRIIKNVQGNFMHATVYFEPALEVAPKILALDIKNELRQATKEIIFLALLHLNHHKMEFPYDYFRNQVWSIDRNFANSCFKGMIEYAKIEKRKYSNPRNNRKDENYAFEDLLNDNEGLINSVLQNTIDIDFKEVSFATHSHLHLEFASQVIPFDTDLDGHFAYIKQVFRMLINALNDTSKRKLGYHGPNYINTKLRFKKTLSRFLLSQDLKRSKKLFNEILNYSFNETGTLSHKALDFIEDIPEQLIIDEMSLKVDRFGDLWKLLEERLRTDPDHPFISYLFLSMNWWDSNRKNWEPLVGKKIYYRNLIADLGQHDIESVVQLLSGIGSDILLPEAITDLRTALSNTSNFSKQFNNSNTFYYTEKLIENLYQEHRTKIKQNNSLRESYLYLLNLMIDVNSSKAFILKERMLSVK